MAKMRKSGEHTELADELESWAISNGIINVPYVSQLSKDIRNRKNLSTWSNLNPMEYLPNPEISEVRTSENLVSLLTVLRNVLVFLPVALTWIAVSKATTAFSVYTNKNSIAVVNFLEFWQDGYGVLAEEWTIGRIAFLDFLLILIVIILTLVSAILGRRNHQKRARLTLNAEAERTSIALKLSAFLFKNQQISPITFDRNMATAINSLLNATSKLDKSVETLASRIKDLPTHRDLLTEIKSIKKQIFKAF